jgi:hypothetical protein
VFKRAGALGASYFALIATGQNTYYKHDHRHTAVLRAGDPVQFDGGYQNVSQFVPIEVTDIEALMKDRR